MLRTKFLYMVLTSALAAGIIAMGGHLEAGASNRAQPAPDELIGCLFLTEEFPLEHVTFDSEVYGRQCMHVLRATVIRSTDLQSGWQRFTTRFESVRQTIELREIDLEDLAKGLACIKAQRGQIVDSAVLPTELEYKNAAIVIRVAFDGVEVRSSVGSRVVEKEHGRRDHWYPVEQLDVLAQLVDQALVKITALKAS